jgi:phage terminase large subunit-like protein
MQIEMSPTAIAGMDDATRGAKLERAIATGFLSRCEDGKVIFPMDDFAPWVRPYIRELTVWTGRPKETADQIDVSSHASQHCRKQRSSWGGVIPSTRHRWSLTH